MRRRVAAPDRVEVFVLGALFFAARAIPPVGRDFVAAFRTDAFPVAALPADFRPAAPDRADVAEGALLAADFVDFAGPAGFAASARLGSLFAAGAGFAGLSVFAGAVRSGAAGAALAPTAGFFFGRPPFRAARAAAIIASNSRFASAMSWACGVRRWRAFSFSSRYVLFGGVSGSIERSPVA